VLHRNAAASFARYDVTQLWEPLLRRHQFIRNEYGRSLLNCAHIFSVCRPEVTQPHQSVYVSDG